MALLAFWAIGLGLASTVRAEDAPSASTVQIAPKVSYEQQRTDHILAEQQLEVEPNPEGKRIAFIRIVRDDVFVQDEIWPLWFNWFHGLTREKVVRRELLFEKGIPYVNARIEETMRNLRGMGIFALVRITPVKAERDGEVGILVLTRDLWSLRLETDFEVTNKLSSFHLGGREVNAFGHNKRLSVDYTLIPKSYELSQSYYARRVFLSSVALSEKAGLVFRRGTNNVEGEVGSIEVGQPYYKLAQRWEWIASYQHDRRVQRNTQNGEILFFPDKETHPEGPHALQVYRRRQENAELYGSFRIGERTKNSFYLGWDYRSLKVNPIAETQLPDSLRDSFNQVLPNGRTDSGPFFTYDFFVTKWVTFVNLGTYGLSENVNVGPTARLSTRVPLKGAGSTYNAVVLAANLGLTLAPNGFLVDLKASGSARLQQGRWIDQKGTLQIRGATPVFSVFRFVARAYWEIRRRDSQATYVALGGDNGLRGYTSGQLRALGADRLLANFELRTLPIEWEAVHVGGVLFYDVGSVFPSPSQIHLYHSVGLGIRIVFPQFNRAPFSFDGGMSFDPAFQFVPTIKAGQVVPLTANEDP